nr:hypothetical protein [Tanacetum cinerariifolium]
MIAGFDRSNETIAKHLEEYDQAAAKLTIGERIELISEMVKYQDHHSKILKYQAQQRKSRTKKQKRDFYIEVIRSILGWKVKDFRGMTFEEVEAKFNSVWKQIEDFIPMSSRDEAERIKRKGINLEYESAKKQKISEEVPKEVKSSDEVPKEKIKEVVQLVPIEEVYVEALQVKHPIIDWKAFPLPVIEFLLAEEVPTASKESSHCQKKRDATAKRIALLCDNNIRRSYNLSFQQVVSELEDHALVADEEAHTEFPLMANSLCSKDCKKNNDSLNRLAQVESRLVEHKDREIKYCEKIIGLEFRTESNNDYIEILKKELKTLKKEKEGNLSWTGLPEFADDTVTDYSRPSPTMESTSGDDKNRISSILETNTSPSSITPKPFIKFVKPNNSPSKSKTGKTETPKKTPVKYAE